MLCAIKHYLFWGCKLIQGKHGGDIYKAAKTLGVDICEISDFSSNVSSFRPESLGKLNFLESISILPEPYSRSLKEAYAFKNKLSLEDISITSGTTEAIEKICRIYSGKKAFIKRPTYSDYEFYCDMFSLCQTPTYESADVCFICNPNNPTGETFCREKLLELINKNPQTMFVVDESYMPFHINEPDFTLQNFLIDNLIVLRSFSKIFGVPGLRLGFAITGNKKIVDTIESMVSPWSVNSLAQEAGKLLVEENSFEVAVKFSKIKELFLQELKKFENIEVTPSDVNFILCKIEGRESKDIFESCLKDKVLIRDCSNFKGLDKGYVRFSLKEDMSSLLTTLEKIL